mmetsp:Transcript_154773/g.281383  ORF Transcript_154773/g.281383 Transcript_154773/m.281383 type:complete len:80 (+) Transcript_154773:406-645(+)
MPQEIASNVATKLLHQTPRMFVLSCCGSQGTASVAWDSNHEEEEGTVVEGQEPCKRAQNTWKGMRPLAFVHKVGRRGMR